MVGQQSSVNAEITERASVIGNMIFTVFKVSPHRLFDNYNGKYTDFKVDKLCR